MSSKLLVPVALLATAVANDRIDCGYISISPDQCIKRGCSYVPSSVPFEPTCFFNASSEVACPLRYDRNSLDNPMYSQQEEHFLYMRFLNNINYQGVGAVIASRDDKTPGGAYTFHWARDAALTMNTMLENTPFVEADHLFQKYIEFETRAMMNGPSFPDVSDVRVEPKFTIPEAHAYTGAWCRPQTDGAPLRIRALANYGSLLVKRGRMVDAQNLMNLSLFKESLDFVKYRWRDNGCDLWEEVQSDKFFWNRYAFIAGARATYKLAISLRLYPLAAELYKVMEDIKASLVDVIRGGLLREEVNSRPNDGAALLALVEFYDEEDTYSSDNLPDSFVLKDPKNGSNFGFLSPLSEISSATVRALVADFCDMYLLNTSDNMAGLPGVLIGRYRYDNFAGGNPWVLHTASLAAYFYESATVALKHEGEFYAMIFSRSGEHFTGLLGEEIKSNPIDFAIQMIGAGDGVMKRLREHSDLRLPEQIDRDNGTPKGAAELTWSFANVIVANAKRESAVKYVKEAQHREKELRF